MTQEEKIELLRLRSKLNSYRQENKELQSQIPHWISVEDELPMEYELVLAAFGNHYARVCFYCGGKWYVDAGVISDEVFGVSHWMPLPQAPKKGEEQ